MSATAVLEPTPRTEAASTRPALRRWLWIGFLVVLAVVGFAVRLRILTSSGGLDGTDGYDDGVYYAAADALVHGRIPYRDFLFLQPPGVVLAISPFAWLGSLTRDPVGVIAARLAFEAVGAGSAVLAALIGRRFGLLAGVGAGVAYAVFYPAAFSERSSLLEPLGSFGLLLAALLLLNAERWPRLGVVLAGVAAGVAIGMKIWYVVPAAVLAAFSWRRILRFVLGVAIGGGALYLPFFLLGPAQMIREVVVDQLGRPRDLVDTPFKRAVSFVGSPHLQHLAAQLVPLLTQRKLGAALIVVLLACAVAALTVRGARVLPALLGATVAVLLVSPSWFLHYGALTGPWVATTFGVGLARIARLLKAVPLRAVVVALVLAAFAWLQLQSVQQARPSQHIPTAALRPAAQAVQGCVVSDDPQILAALDVLSRDLDRGCRLWPDVTGYTYDRDSVYRDGVQLPRRENARWQHDVTQYLTSGQAMIRHRSATGLSKASKRIVDAGPILARSGRWVLHAARR